MEGVPKNNSIGQKTSHSSGNETDNTAVTMNGFNTSNPTPNVQFIDKIKLFSNYLSLLNNLVQGVQYLLLTFVYKYFA